MCCWAGSTKIESTTKTKKNNFYCARTFMKSFFSKTRKSINSYPPMSFQKFPSRHDPNNITRPARVAIGHNQHHAHIPHRHNGSNIAGNATVKRQEIITINHHERAQIPKEVPTVASPRRMTALFEGTYGHHLHLHPHHEFIERME